MLLWVSLPALVGCMSPASTDVAQHLVAPRWPASAACDEGIIKVAATSGDTVQHSYSALRELLFETSLGQRGTPGGTSNDLLGASM